MIARHRALLVTAACVLFAGACSDQPAAPAVPGEIVVTLTTVPSEPAAIMLALDGPGILAIEAADSTDLLVWHPRSSEEAVAILIGEIGAGALISAQVPDVSRAEEYTVRLLQIAAPDGSLSGGGGYSVAVARSASSRLP